MHLLLLLLLLLEVVCKASKCGSPPCRWGFCRSCVNLILITQAQPLGQFEPQQGTVPVVWSVQPRLHPQKRCASPWEHLVLVHVCLAHLLPGVL